MNKFKINYSLVLLIILFNCSLFQKIFSQLKYESSLKEAFKKAKETNKLVFIKYYSETCSHCKRLQEVLDIDTVRNIYEQNFIIYRIEVGNEKNEDLDLLKNNRLHIENVPYLLFFDSEKLFVHYGTPKQEVGPVLLTAKYALDPIERANNLKNRYDHGERDITMLKRYSKLAQIQQDIELNDKIANDIFSLFPKSELSTKKSLIILTNYVTSINNGFFQYWMENWNKLDSIDLENKQFEKYKIFHEILAKDINRNKGKWSLNDFEKARNYVQITGLSSNPYSFFWEEESSLLIKQGEVAKAMNLAMELMSIDSLNTYNIVYQFSYFSNLFNDKESLEKLRIKLIETQKRIEIPALKGELYVYLFRIVKKLGNNNVKNEVKKEGIEYFSKNKLDNTLWKKEIEKK